MSRERQQELDLKKWYDSEREGKDTCGSYDYCKHCDKSVENPCVAAFDKSSAKPAKKTCATKVAKTTTTKTATTKAKAATKTAAKKTTKK